MTRPAIVPWQAVEDGDRTHDDDDEPMGRDADFTRHFRRGRGCRIRS